MPLRATKSLRNQGASRKMPVRTKPGVAQPANIFGWLLTRWCVERSTDRKSALARGAPDLASLTAATGMAVVGHALAEWFADPSVGLATRFERAFATLRMLSGC